MDRTILNMYKWHNQQNCRHQFPIQMENHAWVSSSLYRIKIIELNIKMKDSNKLLTE